MRNTLFLIGICLLASCSTHRKLTSSSTSSTKLEQKSETQENATLTDNSATKRDSTGSRTQSQSDTTRSNTSIKITEYDTSKPTNPATGRPPVLRETEINHNSSSGHNSSLEQHSSVSDQKQNDVKAASNKSGKSAVKASGKEARKTVEVKDSRFPWWIVILTTTVLGSIFYAAVRFSWWGKVIEWAQRVLK